MQVCGGIARQRRLLIGFIADQEHAALPAQIGAQAQGAGQVVIGRQRQAMARGQRYAIPGRDGDQAVPVRCRTVR